MRFLSWHNSQTRLKLRNCSPVLADLEFPRRTIVESCGIPSFQRAPRRFLGGGPRGPHRTRRLRIFVNVYKCIQFRPGVQPKKTGHRRATCTMEPHTYGPAHRRCWRALRSHKAATAGRAGHRRDSRSHFRITATGDRILGQSGRESRDRCVRSSLNPRLRRHLSARNT